MNATAATLRVLLFTMLAMVAVYFGVGFLLLAGDWHVETVRTIDSGPDRVAAVAGDLRTWDRWAGVDCFLGPQTTRTVLGAPGTVDHRIVWAGSRGKATLAFESVAPGRIDYRYVFEREGSTEPPPRNTGSIVWTAEGTGCRVVWRDEGEWPSLAFRWFGWFGALQQKTKHTQVTSLEGLQNELRTQAPEPVVPPPK
jgi:hypothetical protein